VEKLAAGQEAHMGDQILRIETDKKLLDSLRKSAGKAQSPADLKEQRVSFIYGSLDRESDVTRERIRQALMEQEGGSVK
jgi:hypothetical protein